MEKKIKNIYVEFFSNLGIKKKGTFPQKSRWSFLRFPTYPLIGSRYAENKDRRVLFIGLDIGKDENPRGGIIGFKKKRMLVENNEKHNSHGYGMGVATIFLLKNLFRNNQREKILKSKTYKSAFKLAKRFKSDFNPFSYIAMTNCYKFVTKNQRIRSGSKDRKHIFTDAEWDLLEDEVRILEPKFLVFESKDFIRDHWFTPLISEIKRQNKNMKIYISNHPSGRGLHSNTLKYLKPLKGSSLASFVWKTNISMKWLSPRSLLKTESI